MPRQLNIRSDEAYERAHRVAERKGITVTEAVVIALRGYDAVDPPLPTYDDLTPEQKREVDAFRARARKARAEALAAGFTEEQLTQEYIDNEMYDEHGLPR
jgi:hypothetical protein